LHGRLNPVSLGTVSKQGLSILVADDEADIRDLLLHWLKEAGHGVELVASGSGAVAALRQRPCDLVVTDVLMPDGDGLELIEAAKRLQPAVRILAISGGGRYLEIEDCLKLARGWGAHAVLMKPFNREQLLAAIEAAFAPPEPRG